MGILFYRTATRISTGRKHSFPKEVTLFVWSGAEQKNITSSDTSVESEQIFRELFDTLCHQKEDTEDIRVMGTEGFEAIHDGVIQCGEDSISFLNDKFTMNQETFGNAWYLEVRTNGSHMENCVILPDGSKYLQMLKQLLDNLHYH